MLSIDLRYAFRLLRRHWLTSGFAIAVLALGCGAAIAVYSGVRGVALRELPYPDSERLFLVWRSTADDPLQRGPLSPRDLLDLSEQLPAAAALGAINSFSTAYTPDDGAARQLALGVVTGDFFGAAGVRAQLGRALEPADDRVIDTRDTTVTSVVVLSHAFWERELGADTAVLGRVLRFGGSRMQVVGVMPESFAVHMPVDAGMSTDLVGYTPLGVNALTSDRSGGYLKVWARLRPGASSAALDAQLQAAAGRLRAAHTPHADAGLRLRAEPLEREVIAHAYGVLLLLAVTGIVTLLVACANVGALMLVQFMGRTRELTVRGALGATRTQLTRQLVTEAALLSICGVAAGLAVASIALPLLLRLDPGLIPKSWAVRIDGGVLLFALGMAGLTTALCGVVPAGMIARAQSWGALRAREGVPRGTRRLRSAAVVAQVAGAVLLVYGSIALGATLERWRSADYGFDPAGVHTFQLTLPFTQYRGPAAWLPFFDQLRERLAQVPGVEAVAVASDLPMLGEQSLEPWLPEDQAETAPWGEYNALHRSVSPGYFDAAGIRITEGRSFAPSDGGGALTVAIVDETLAAQLRRGEPGPVVGRRIDVTRHSFSGGYSVERVRADIVGVAATVPHDHPDAEPPGTIYLPHAQYPLWAMNVLVRGSAGRTVDAELVRSAVAELDARLPIVRERPLADVVQARLATTRFLLALVAFLALVVGALAAAGLFAMVAESVRQGRRELGIRLALGATTGRVVRSVLGAGTVLVAGGLVIGAVLSPFVGRLAADTIQARSAGGPVTLAAAAVLVFALGVVACYVPARRAAGIDPARTLREE